MTPLFRVRLVLFFRVTEKPLQVSYYKIQIVVYFYIHTRKAVTFAYWNFFCFFMLKKIKTSNMQMRQLYAYVANESNPGR